jgi:hypothetical protein
MKKQLLIAAVAASMTSVAMADVSISGSSKANVVDGAASIEADLAIVGKSGATSVVANISLDTGMNPGDAIVEDLYMTSSFEGVNIKVGEYRSGKSELDQTSTDATARYKLDTTFGGITVAHEGNAAASTNEWTNTVSGSVAGVSIAHSMKQNKNTETTLSGSMSGVNLTWNREHKNSDSSNDTAITVSTEMNGVTATYVKLDTDNAVPTDGYVGKFTTTAGKTASAFGLSTSVAGNTITLKSIDNNDTDSTKIVVNRVLASGATFEAVYTDNSGDTKDTLDLELAVKF